MKTKRLYLVTCLVILAMLLSAAGVNAGPPPAVKAAGLSETTDYPDMPDPLLTFEGLGRVIWPDPRETFVPDTSGDVGRTRYIQAVNKSIAIYKKTGEEVVRSTFDEFWSYADTGTPCDTLDNITAPVSEAQAQQLYETHHGQPNVVHDDMARRWLVMDVAYENILTGPYFFCIAVTKAEDSIRAGEEPDDFDDSDWLFYALPVMEDDIGPNYLPQQPRIGLWPDGYYIAADLVQVLKDDGNLLSVTPQGAKVWAINREGLYKETLKVKWFQLSEDLGYHGLLPSNLRGNPPTSGTPNYFTAIAPPNNFYIWKFSVDWNSNVAVFGQMPSMLPDFVLSMNTPFTWPTTKFAVPQWGADEKLDVLGDRLSSVMYRIVDGMPSLWASHTVYNNSEGGTELRWYEVRNLEDEDDGPAFYQQGIYHPEDTDDTDDPDELYPWNSGIGVDGEGDMALGFSFSSEEDYPSIKYIGRLASDPMGTLPYEAEYLWEGWNYQAIPLTIREDQEPWGRKSAMTVDPVDDCIFWYTNEYYDENTLQWHTRIGFFRFPSCGQGTTARASLSTSNVQGNAASGDPLDAYSAGISENGRFVVFSSEASNLVDSDTNGDRDVFVRDRDVDEDGVFDEPGQVKTTRLSLDSEGIQVQGDSWEVAISQDGRFVAFSSDSRDLVDDDNNGTRDIFVRDRDVDGDGDFDEPGEVSTFRVSVPDDEAYQEGNNTESDGQSDQPTIAVYYEDVPGCPSGCVYTYLYVAFRSFATNLVKGADYNFTSDIFVYSQTPWGTETRRVSNVYDEPWEAGNGPSYTPSIAAFDSKPGYSVAFTSEATNLMSTDTNGSIPDIYVFHRSSPGWLFRASVADYTEDVQADGPSYSPSISDDGKYVAFISWGRNLVDRDEDPADVFIRDVWKHHTQQVSESFLGYRADGNSYTPSISEDGRFVAFASDATNLDLVPDMNGQRDIFLFDRLSGLITHISDGYNGQADGMSRAPVISADGRHVAYPSRATNLVTNDSNNYWDVFVHDRKGTIPTFLAIGSNVMGNPNKTVKVPIVFSANNQSIDTLTFSVDFDEECLTFQDMEFPEITGFKRSYSFNADDKDGELDFLFKASTAGESLPDGAVLAKMKFEVSGSCQAMPDESRTVRVGFSEDPPASFAKLGASIRGQTADGSVEIVSGKLGDCNGDGKEIGAADISALVLEIFDEDGDAPIDTPQSTFRGNAVGCNPNQDVVVDAGDISCDLLLLFGQSCGDIQPEDTASLLQLTQVGQASSPSLNMPLMFSTAAGDKLAVPISLKTAGNPINTLTFQVVYNPALLAFDQDGFALNLPAGFRLDLVNPDYAAGKVGFVIHNPANPAAALTDGEIITLNFTALAPVNGTDIPVYFASRPGVSFGTTIGKSPPGYVVDAKMLRRLFIPSLIH